MPLKLMYITNKLEVARIAQAAGVDRIFVDMEFIGKAQRQGGMDTVQNHHTPEDVRNISGCISSAQLLVRVNPIHGRTDGYMSSEEEINEALNNGAQILMLPYFKTVSEVEKFIELVNGRAKVMPLLETPQAVACIDEILRLEGIDEIFIGLNDLSLGYKKKFMFELLSDGTVEELCVKFKKARIPYGFGGIAALGSGALPAEKIIREHYRLGSSSVILSRSFCNTDLITDLGLIREIFSKGIEKIRSFEEEVSGYSSYFSDNEKEIQRIVNDILKKKE